LPYLKKGVHPETPKPGDPIFERTRTFIVGGNAVAIRAATEAASALGFAVTALTGIEGDAARAGRELAREAKAGSPPAAVIYGGETTVLVGKKQGRGGRNQEAALAAAIEIAGATNLAIATFATDGVDGPTVAAGAIVTGATLGAARALGLDPAGVLKTHDSYTFFDALDKAGLPHLIKTGATGTNANDILIALAYQLPCAYKMQP